MKLAALCTCVALLSGCSDPEYARSGFEGSDLSSDPDSDASGHIDPHDLAPDDAGADPHDRGDAGFEPDTPDPAPDVCLTLSTNWIDFGGVGPDQPQAASFEASNCALDAVHIEIGLAPGGSPAYSVSPATDGDEPIILGAGESLEVTVRFRSTAQAEHAGAVVVRAGAAQSLVELTARVSDEFCPIAAAAARIRGEANGAEAVLGRVGDTLELDGRASTAPTRVAHWIWSVVERPRGSASLLGDGPTPSLLLDTAGHYAFTLTVVDDHGRPSCNVARVEATAHANDGIDVQLDWDTPGTDVDLHLLHPDGRWDTSPYDCYWLNRSPNWGRLDDTSDDPALWLDSVDGLQPERIVLALPQAVTYRVGAYYFSDHGEGPTHLRARIWVGGALAYDQTTQLSDRTFWEIATITWGPEPYVDDVNRIHDDFP